jgi:hypothetical protein
MYWKREYVMSRSQTLQMLLWFWQCLVEINHKGFTCYIFQWKLWQDKLEYSQSQRIP